MADKIGEFVVLKGAPMELLAVLTEASHPLALHPDSAAALEEMRTLFSYLEVRGRSCSLFGCLDCISLIWVWCGADRAD